MQKEAFFMSKKCITLREQTEWVETLENGNNVLCGADKSKIVTELTCNKNFVASTNPYGMEY